MEKNEVNDASPGRGRPKRHRSRSPQQEDPPWSIGGGGRPVDSGPRFFHYKDRGFRGGWHTTRAGSFRGRRQAAATFPPTGTFPKPPRRSRKIPPGRFGAGGVGLQGEPPTAAAGGDLGRIFWG